MNLCNLQKKEDRFNTVQNSDGEPVPFCDVEYHEDNQCFDDYTIPDAPPPIFIPYSACLHYIISSSKYEC